MFKKKKQQITSGQVIIPGNHPNPPEQHEVDAAMLLTRHYLCDVEFILPVDDYLRNSADIMMLGVTWELKCPKGNSKSTIQNQFRRGSKQARNIIIDTRRTKLKYDVIEKRVLVESRNRPYMKKIILIDKFDKIIEFKK